MNNHLKSLVIIPLVLGLMNSSYARSKAVPPKSLKDVPQNHWAANEAQELYDTNVMVGDPNGAFRGNSMMTRYEMAVALSNLINNNNRELLEDREDLASLVNIMEQFQNELSAIDARLTKLTLDINNTLGSMSGTVDAVHVQSEEVSSKIDATGAEIAVIKGDVEKLKNRGLIYGTIIKGTANDAHTVAKGIVYVAKKVTNNDDNDNYSNVSSSTKEVDAEVIEQHLVPLPSSPAETVQSKTQSVESVTVFESKPQTVTPVAKAAKKIEEIKVETTKSVTTQHAETLRDGSSYSYVPRMQTAPLQQQRSSTTSYEAPKSTTASPKVTKAETSHEYHSSEELDGELIQEIHQTLQEMH